MVGEWVGGFFLFKFDEDIFSYEEVSEFLDDELVLCFSFLNGGDGVFELS